MNRYFGITVQTAERKWRKMTEYTKHYYGKHGTRMNPNYPPHHVFTVCRCEKCGEDYEADRKHICKQQNSYPVGNNEEDD